LTVLSRPHHGPDVNPTRADAARSLLKLADPDWLVVQAVVR
jgi:hypothetical protein